MKRFEWKRCPVCFRKEIKQVEVDKSELSGWVYKGQELCGIDKCKKRESFGYGKNSEKT